MNRQEPSSPLGAEVAVTHILVVTDPAPPHDWGSEIRCFLRDPDGHLVEISQSKAG